MPWTEYIYSISPLWQEYFWWSHKHEHSLRRQVTDTSVGHTHGGHPGKINIDGHQCKTKHLWTARTRLVVIIARSLGQKHFRYTSLQPVSILAITFLNGHLSWITSYTEETTGDRGLYTSTQVILDCRLFGTSHLWSSSSRAVTTPPPFPPGNNYTTGTTRSAAAISSK
jgi:hypothetical protein